MFWTKVFGDPLAFDVGCTADATQVRLAFLGKDDGMRCVVAAVSMTTAKTVLSAAD